MIPAATPMTAVLLWVLALILEPGIYSPGSALLIGVGWLILTTTATVGIVLVGGRWAKNTLLGVLATTLPVAVSRPLDLVSWIALAFTATAAVILLTPQQTRLVRKLPSAAGPPPKAVFVTLAAAALPLALGLVPTEPNAAVFVMATAGVVSSFAYSRTIPGGLLLMRYGLPLLALTLAFFMNLPHAVVAIATTVAISAVALSSDVAVAFRPLIEKGTTYAIPPELAPREIRDGAGIDDRGKPL